MKKILFLIIFIISSLFSQVDYASQIQPIFNANCTTCHYSSGGMGSLNLTSFSELMNGGVSGPSVVAGDHQNSLLYQRIVLPPGTDGNMPPNVPLSQSQIDIIASWIDQGASLQISDNISISPEKHTLYQNYPNPFNPNTTLSYILSRASFVNITVYDMAGKAIKTIINSSQNAGLKKVEWNATNDKNEPVSAGLYIYKMQTNEFTKTKKMLLLK
ncbi:MAG: T9SS type A sorting domain-containing protein [Candidatus Marinimicrobia bacterium]|nr:T9SS type A sorting domain-containing protein [Candidatus Neomarinimicrobiota bacterium]